MRRRIPALIGFCVLLLTFPLLAQEQTATIHGTAMDVSGAALPGVTVEAVNVKGQRFSTETDSSGNFRLPAVPPGTYTVTGTLSGMQPAMVRGLQVSLGTAPKVELKLDISAVSETITVTSEVPIVDTTSNAVQSSVTAATFERLPIGRDFQSIVTLTPSAVIDPKSGGNGTYLESSGTVEGLHYGGVSIDGTTAAESRYVLDGVDTTDAQTGTAGNRLVTDMIEEVQVKSAGYQAEFGGALGGVVNVVSKTGTNDFHGTVGGHYLDSGLGGGAERPTLRYDTTGEAGEYVTYRKDDLQRLEPGFTLGGPIVPDKVWFFGAYVPTIITVERKVDFVSGNTATFDQDFRRENLSANVNGNFGSNFSFKASANLSPYETTNLLPLRSGRGTEDAASYLVNDKKDESAYSAYGDYMPTPKFYLSLRGGRFETNYEQSGVPSGVRILFTGSNSFYDAPANLVRPSGYNTPNNSATSLDKYTRDNLNFDVSWFPTFAGVHSFKTGVQMGSVKNQVVTGEQNLYLRFRWNRSNAYGLPGRGTYGVMQARQFQTTGDVTDETLAVFVQDQWNVNDRLTLNLGVRAEKEQIPSYNAGLVSGVNENAIEFDFADKFAPRFGFAYDLVGDNRWKLYGSYGDYYDVFKLELPRGAFGGDKWIDYNFALNTLDWTAVQCTGNPNLLTLQCTGGVEYLNRINLRAASNDPSNPEGSIDPDLKPSQSREFSLGVQHEFSPLMAFGARYTNKRLVRTVEDIGSYFADSEAYLIGNPGEGLGRQAWYQMKGMWPEGFDYPGFPKAKRDYDAVELEFTRRFASKWSAHASYLWSRLYGNYSGLVNADEATGVSQSARVAPNVSRWGDMPWAPFDATGEPVYGLLPQDRTHQFKIQASYQAPWGTQFAINQYAGSGTPLSTAFEYNGVHFLPFGRNDMGRTPWLTATDLMIGHLVTIGGRYGLLLQVNVLNVFDQKNVIGREELWTGLETLSGDATEGLTFAQFFHGFDAYAVAAEQGLEQDPLYGNDSNYQAPRQVQLQIKFTF